MWLLVSIAVAASPVSIGSAPALTAKHVATSTAIAGAGLGLTIGLQSAFFAAEGTVRPGLVTLTAAITSIFVVGLTQLILPLWSTDKREAVARQTLLWGAGAAAAAGLGVILAAIGSGLEGQRYGSGQVVLATGLLTVVLGLITHQVLAPIGAAKATGW
jgi:hypothetical protein